MKKRKNNEAARKVWISHNGPIPKDENGRSYEIHHIDGNPKNNSLENLLCVTINEHYEIHRNRGDWGAAALIARRSKMTLEEISKLTKSHNEKMIENGTHPFLKRPDGTSVGLDVAKRLIETGTHNFIGSPYAAKMYENGTHPFLGGTIQRATNARRINERTHNLLGDRNPSHERVKNRTHHLLGSTINKKRLENGTHVSQLKVSCIFCRKELDKANFSRSHGNKCKMNPNPFYTSSLS
jgi:hypothetical protein